MAKLLLVDDNEELRMMLAWLLEDRGHEVVQAGSAKEAIDALEADADLPERVFTDRDMERPDIGYDVCRMAEKMGLAREHIVVVSGRDKPKAGDCPWPYLVKPVEVRDLLKMIQGS